MSTPTPAPTLTDEQIDADMRHLARGEFRSEEQGWAIIAAVIARAKREERESLVRWLGNLAGQIVGEPKASSALVWAAEMLARTEATDDETH